MAILLWVLLSLAGFVALTFLAVLAVPIKARAEVADGDGYHLRATARWLFRLVAVELEVTPRARVWRLLLVHRVVLERPLRPRAKRPEERAEEKAPGGARGTLARLNQVRRSGVERVQRARQKRGAKARRGAERPAGARTNLDRLRDLSPALFGEVMRTLGRLIGSLHLRAGGRLRFGLDDPADTGMLLGLLWAVKGAGDLATLTLDADFDGLTLSGNAWAECRVGVGTVLWIVLRLIWARSVRKMWWAEVTDRLRRRFGRGPRLAVE